MVYPKTNSTLRLAGVLLGSIVKEECGDNPSFGGSFSLGDETDSDAGISFQPCVDVAFDLIGFSLAAY